MTRGKWAVLGLIAVAVVGIAVSVLCFARRPAAPPAPSLVPIVFERPVGKGDGDDFLMKLPSNLQSSRQNLWREVWNMPTSDQIRLGQYPELLTGPLYYQLLAKGEFALAIPKILEILDKDPMIYVQIDNNAVSHLYDPMFLACSFDSELNWSSTKDQAKVDEMRGALARFHKWWDSTGKNGDPDAWGKEHAEELVAKARAKIKEGNRNGIMRLYVVQATGNADAMGDWPAFERWWEIHKDEGRAEWVRGLVGEAIKDLSSDNDTVRKRAAYRLDDYGILPIPLPDLLEEAIQQATKQKTMSEFES